jgi:ribonuclease HI
MTYYAVISGRVPGIYTCWKDASPQVNFYPGAIFKKFTSRKEAEEFMGATLVPNEIPDASTGTSALIKIKPKIRINTKTKDGFVEPDSMEAKYYSHPSYQTYEESNVIHIYTDGSTFNNGKKGATGGYGVFFGIKTIKNIQQRITSGKITNNVAELTAIIEAMKIINVYGNKQYIIHYDSKYAAGVTDGSLKAIANLKLVKESKDLYALTRHKFTFKHIKSHSKLADLHSLGNEIADRLAKGLKKF